MLATIDQSVWLAFCVNYQYSTICDICTPLTEVGGRVRLRSAHRGDLCVPSTRTEFSKRSFRVAAPRTWNSLTLHLRSPTIRRQQFQSGLKTHLFKRAYKWLLPPRTIEEWTYLLTYLFTYLLCHMKIGPISKLSYVRFLPEVKACHYVKLSAIWHSKVAGVRNSRYPCLDSLTWLTTGTAVPGTGPQNMQQGTNVHVP